MCECKNKKNEQVTVEEVKNDFLSFVNKIDKSTLSLGELKCYAETLKLISEINTSNFFDYYEKIQDMTSCSCYQPQPVTLTKNESGCE